MSNETMREEMHAHSVHIPTPAQSQANMLNPRALKIFSRGKHTYHRQLRIHTWAGDTERWVRALVTKPDNLSVTSGAHRVEGEKQHQELVL